MNTSSHPWKQELARKAAILQPMAGPHRLTDSTAAKLEETVVVGCYAIRRLVNGFLIPESRIHHPVAMTAFPHRRQTIPVLGDEPLPTRYDLGAGRLVNHDLVFLCHQVLQNCIFEPWQSADHSLIGILVTSDHQRKIALYGVTLPALIELFHRIGTED